MISCYRLPAHRLGAHRNFLNYPLFTIEILTKRSLRMTLELKCLLIYGDLPIPFEGKCNFIGYKLFLSS